MNVRQRGSLSIKFFLGPLSNAAQNAFKEINKAAVVVFVEKFHKASLFSHIICTIIA